MTVVVGKVQCALQGSQSSALIWLEQEEGFPAEAKFETAPRII